MITHLTLEPGGEKTVFIVLPGGDSGEPAFPAVPLAPGRYRVFARLGHPYERQSNALALTVE
ncbi:MAG: hypothetical protein ACREMC_11620 [Gemmatimonadales bacterium]